MNSRVLAPVVLTQTWTPGTFFASEKLEASNLPWLGIKAAGPRVKISGVSRFAPTCKVLPIWVFPKIMVPPNHPILIGFSIINHPFWGTIILGNTHIVESDVPFHFRVIFRFHVDFPSSTLSTWKPNSSSLKRRRIGKPPWNQRRT